jgi:agmatinase
MDITNFNPNGVGLNNGRFIGLPFSENDAKVVIISVPWDVTVSYNDGTATAPENILKASLQLDLFQIEINEVWKLGIFMRPSNPIWLKRNNELRPKAKKYIEFLEKGGGTETEAELKKLLDEVNLGCEKLNEEVYLEARSIIEKNQIPAIVGGEHSVPLGLLKALHEHNAEFGVLHIDAHMDLRNAYEGFEFSHASIFNNAKKMGYVKNLVQVGIRDFCAEEVEFARPRNITVFYDEIIKQNIFRGINWHEQCLQIIETLPENVYVSFDIDGLKPHLCPNTGTPVPGGLEFADALYLIKELVRSGKKIIGFDLCEVGGVGHEWDGNVGARVLYALCNWAGRSQGLI